MTTYITVCVGAACLRVPRRALAVNVIIGLACAAVAIVALMIGDYPLSVADTLRAIVGTGDNALASYFVRELRAPRVIAALLVGAALGISGAIFQNVTRNPLGSPDITGFTTGAATGAVIAIMLFDATPVLISFGAIAGGCVTGALVFALARSSTTSTGLGGITFVLIGVGVSFALRAVNHLLVVRASLDKAQQSAIWLAGSFNAVTWPPVVVLVIALAVLVPLSLVLARPLTVMLAGDEVACGLGVDVPKRRRELIAVGVALSAVAVAAAGPISFVALAAPQLARLIARAPGVGFGGSALVGALLVASSDVIAQRAFAPVQLPVGVVTGVLGGVYLIWLLAHEWRKSS
ncbi:FecCD family ABC transporter permease [Corynebacterium auris]|uniref:FecCD family ABC transporter permease n=1 Tax=Corynebacterium auris TaxID=44750 RepID=UPI0025B4F3E7|nr:iron chelate uptake ABC transporter family permease subunit [Corynebacterium auris]WJY68455.1 Ferric enterobactin transport system permease protein FepG [Corynebacterium auris]